MSSTWVKPSASIWATVRAALAPRSLIPEGPWCSRLWEDTSSRGGVVVSASEATMADPAPSFDADKAKAFTRRMVQHLEGSAITIMIEVGRRVGLFEAMAHLDWSTSREIATEAGLSERYAREWLAAMVCGGIVEHDPVADTYRLPPEHAAGLTGATTQNLSSIAEMVTLM